MVSRRALSAKEKGRKGGLATARNHSVEFLEARSAKAGSATRDKYGVEYYAHIRTSKARKKSAKQKTDELIQSIIPVTTIPTNSLELMEAAAKIYE